MIRVELEGIEDVRRMLRRVESDTPPALKTAHRRIGGKVAATAKDYCPESPNKAQVNRTLKRKKRTTRRTDPGRLRKSISVMEVTDAHVDIGVPPNSDGGKYAHYIHDQKGSRWHRRGPGTVAKGDKADDKFIERAVKDDEDDIMDIYMAEIRRLIRKATDASS